MVYAVMNNLCRASFSLYYCFLILNHFKFTQPLFNIYTAGELQNISIRHAMTKERDIPLALLLMKWFDHFADIFSFEH